MSKPAHSLLFLPFSVLLSSVSTLAQCQVASGQSIVAQMMPTSAYALDDEGRSADIALVGFTFAIGGVAYTHFVVESNGEVYLTDGNGVIDPAPFGVSSLSALRGTMGASPRVVAIGGDLQGHVGLADWDVLVDDSVAGQVTVTWTGMRFYQGDENFCMSVTLIVGGLVRFDYADGDFGVPSFANLAGVSAGNGVGTGIEPSSDLNGGADSGAVALIYQNDWSPFDLAGQSIVCAPNGSGGFAAVIACGEARHFAFGTGCYDVGGESFYQHFTDAAVAAQALTGHALILSPTATGYAASWFPNVASTLYLAPSSSATPLAVGNDGEVLFTPSAGFPSPYGPITDLTVQGNGIIAFGDGPVAPAVSNWIPDPSQMMAGPHGGVYFWHAYNQEEGGQVWAEEVAGITCITFADVESFPLLISNPSTVQVQFDQTGGDIFVLFVHIDSNNAPVLGLYPQDHVIGFTPPGASIDPGSIDLLTQLPLVTTPDQEALALRATPRPMSTAIAGSTVVYHVEHALAGTAGGVLAVGLVLFSATRVPAVDLGFLDAPGCSGYLGSLDAAVAFAAPIAASSVSLTVPAGLPQGVKLFAQAVSMSFGARGIGLLTSNGLESVIGRN